MIDHLKKTIVLVFFLAAYTSTFAHAQSSDSYSINADDVITDSENNAVIYQGNAKVVFSNLVLEADSISIFKHNGFPSKITAVGNPIKFHEKVPKQHINGTAKKATFFVPELKLTVIEYSITDPTGNNMKGKKASFVFAP